MTTAVALDSDLVTSYVADVNRSTQRMARVQTVEWVHIRCRPTPCDAGHGDEPQPVRQEGAKRGR